VSKRVARSDTVAGGAGRDLPGPERDPTMKTHMTITAAKVLTAVAFLAAIGAPKKW
jgi:hypothetical protein